MAPRRSLYIVLNDEEIEEISAEIKSKLEHYIREQERNTEDLKIENEQLRINLEQQQFEIEKQLEECRESLTATTEERDEAKSRIEELITKLTAATEEIQELQGKNNTLTSEEFNLKHAADVLEIQKQDLVEVVESKTKQIEALQDERKSLVDKVHEANKEKCEALTKVEEIASKELTLDYKEKRLDQELSLLQDQLDSVQQELTKKTAEMCTLRKDKAQTTAQLQGELAQKTEELNLNEKSMASLKKQLTDEQERLEQLTGKLQEQRESRITVEEQYKQEIRSQTRLAELYKESSEDAQSQIKELTTAVEELQKLLQESSEEQSQAEQKVIDVQEEYSSAVQHKDSTIQELQQQLNNANDLLLALKRQGLTDDDLAALSPAAASASKMLRTGMTLTQIYSSYITQSDELRTEREENSRLNRYMEQILKEIEERAPKFKKQREDYEASLGTITLLGQQLTAAMTECENLRSEALDNRRQLTRMNRDYQRLTQQNSDLGRQVCVLLKEIEEAHGGPVSTDAVVTSSDLSTADSVVSSKLVTFRSVQELQQQNQHLLTVVRELSAQAEDTERQVTDIRIKELQGQLELAALEVAELKAITQKHADMVDVIAQQRDTYKSLVTQPPTDSVPATPPSCAALAEKQAQVDHMKKQMDIVQDKFKKENEDNSRKLNEQLTTLRNELSDSKIQIAKVSSKLEFSNDRYKNLQFILESHKKEVAALTEKNQSVSVLAHKHEQTIATIRSSVSTAEEKLVQSQTLEQRMRAQLQLVKASESRLLQEKETLHREKTSQQLVLCNLQKIQNNLDRTEQEIKSGLKLKLDEMEKQYNMLNQLHKTESERFKNADETFKKQLSELKEKAESESVKNAKTQDELVDAYANVHSLKQEIADLERKLSEEAKAHMNADAGVMQIATTKDSEIRDLKSQLKESAGEIKVFKDQLQQAKASVDQFKGVADGAEKQLREQAQSTKTLQQTLEQKVQKSQQEMKEMEQKMNQAQQNSARLEKENIDVRQQTTKQVTDMTVQLTNCKKEMESMRESLKETERRLEVATNESKVLGEQAKEATTKLNTQMQLHSQEVKALNDARAKVEELGTQISTLENTELKFKAVENEHMESWQAKEKALVEETERATVRCKELEDENKVLMERIDKLSTQITALKSMEPIAQHTDAEKSDEQMMETIKFLRKDCESAQARSELLKTENTGLLTQVDLLQKRLDEQSKEIVTASQQLASSSEHAELLKRVELLNVLEDTNRRLVAEKEELQKTSSSTQQIEQIKQLEDEQTAMRQKMEELATQHETITAENQTIRNESKRWQQMYKQVLEQGSRVGQEEQRRLVQERDNLRQQVTTFNQQQTAMKAEENKLKAEISRIQNEETRLKTEEAQLQAKLKSANDELSTMKTSLDSLKTEVSNLQTALDTTKTNTQTENSTLQANLQTKESQLTELQKTMQQLKKLGRKYKLQYDELQPKYDELLSKQESAAGSDQNTTGAEQNPAETQQQLQAAQQELTDANNRLAILEEKIKLTETEANDSKRQTETKLADAEKRLKSMEEKASDNEGKLREAETKMKEAEAKMKEAEAKIKEAESKLKESEDRIRESETRLREHEAARKTMEERMTELENLKKTEEVQFAEKEEKTKKLMLSVRQRLSQLTEQKETLSKELDDMKAKLSTSEQSNEETSMRTNSLKSQYENRITRLERELQEVQEDRARLLQQIDQLNDKVEIQQRQLEAAHKPSKAVKVSSPAREVGILQQGTDTPPTANIKPISTSSAQSVSRLPPSQSSTSGSRTTPTASIRPIAVSAPTSSTAVRTVVLPTTSGAPSSSSMQEEPSTSTSGVPQATVAPTQSIARAIASVTAVVAEHPPIAAVVAVGMDQQHPTTATVQPMVTTSSPDTSTSRDVVQQSPADSVIGVVNPTVAVAGLTEAEEDALLAANSDTEPEGKHPHAKDLSEAQASTSSSGATKRSRELGSDSSDTKDMGVKGRQDKRLRTAQDSDIIVIESMASGAESHTASSHQSITSSSEETPKVYPKVESRHATESSLQVTPQSASQPAPPVPQRRIVADDDNDIIIVESTDEDNSEEEEEVGSPSSVVVQSEMMEAYEDDQTDQEDSLDDRDEGMEDDPLDSTTADEPMLEHDNDVVEIQDDDSDAPPMEADERQDTSRSQTAAGSSQAAPSSFPAYGRPFNLSTIPPRQERLPSVGRQLTPYMPGHGSGFEEGDDGIVPSTPTLFVPRRTDGFAEAVSSPHVSHGRFLFGTMGEMVVPSSHGMSQLATQALGVDDTRMDLSQFDYGTGRSVPTTPLQVSPPAAVADVGTNLGTEVSTSATSDEAPSIIVTSEDDVSSTVGRGAELTGEHAAGYGSGDSLEMPNVLVVDEGESRESFTSSPRVSEEQEPAQDDNSDSYAVIEDVSSPDNRSISPDGNTGTQGASSSSQAATRLVRNRGVIVGQSAVRGRRIRAPAPSTEQQVRPPFRQLRGQFRRLRGLPPRGDQNY